LLEVIEDEPADSDTKRCDAHDLGILALNGMHRLEHLVGPLTKGKLVVPFDCIDRLSLLAQKVHMRRVLSDSAAALGAPDVLDRLRDDAHGCVVVSELSVCPLYEFSRLV